jgi:hypothetical protein
MSDPRFIFNTLDYQNGANSFNNYVNTMNAASNSVATGNSFRFQSDADRMKYLIGSQGQSRLSGYYNGLYATYYALTVLQNGSTIPSIDGPGNTGWGRLLHAEPTTNAIIIDDALLTKKTGLGNYVGVQYSGYIYSPVATTITFQATSDDGIAIYFNGTLVINGWIYQGPATYTSALVNLQVGYNPIRILFFEGAGGAVLRFNYTITGGQPQTSLNCDCFYNYAQM